MYNPKAKFFTETYWLGLFMLLAILGFGIAAIHTGDLRYMWGVLGAVMVVVIDQIRS